MLYQEKKRKLFTYKIKSKYTPAVNEDLTSMWKEANFRLMHGKLAHKSFRYNEGSSWSQYSTCSDLTVYTLLWPEVLWTSVHRTESHQNHTTA